MRNEIDREYQEGLPQGNLNVLQTIKRSKIVVAITAAALMAVSAIPAFAAPGNDPNPGNGYDKGYAAPGYDSARDNTVCADHGAFGYYAHGAMTTYDTPRAADGAQTAINNSNLCGNPQGVPGL